MASRNGGFLYFWQFWGNICFLCVQFVWCISEWFFVFCPDFYFVSFFRNTDFIFGFFLPLCSLCGAGSVFSCVCVIGKGQQVLRACLKSPLPCRAKPAAGGFPRKMHPHFAWGPGEGRGGGGGMLFMNRNSGFFNRLLPSPRPSLAARAVPVPRGEGAYWLFSRFSVSYTSIRKNAVLQDFEQALNLLPNGCHGAAARKRSTVAAMSFAWVMAEMTAMPSAPAR